MMVVGRAAKAADTAIAIFVHELRDVPTAELAAPVTSLHRSTQQRLPVIPVGAGLPQPTGRMGKAKSHAERLLEVPALRPLSRDDARRAQEKPALDEGAEFDRDAPDRILDAVQGSPHVLQEWGRAPLECRGRVVDRRHRRRSGIGPGSAVSPTAAPPAP